MHQMNFSNYSNLVTRVLLTTGATLCKVPVVFCHDKYTFIINIVNALIFFCTDFSIYSIYFNTFVVVVVVFIGDKKNESPTE